MSRWNDWREKNAEKRRAYEREYYRNNKKRREAVKRRQQERYRQAKELMLEQKNELPNNQPAQKKG